MFRARRVGYLTTSAVIVAHARKKTSHAREGASARLRDGRRGSAGRAPGGAEPGDRADPDRREGGCRVAARRRAGAARLERLAHRHERLSLHRPAGTELVELSREPWRVAPLQLPPPGATPGEDRHLHRARRG